MGRELRRKQAKKEGKSLERNEMVEAHPIKKMTIITCILVLTITIIYLVTALFITKELDWFNNNKEEDTSENSVENSILASAIFKQSEEEYYVYFYDFSDEEENVSSLIENKLSSEKVYRVDTSSVLNSKYVGETSNKNAKTIDELKVTAPTLIKVSGDTIIEYYEKLEITNNL